jgi:hypothetical protein
MRPWSTLFSCFFFLAHGTFSDKMIYEHPIQETGEARLLEVNSTQGPRTH